jgi:hypothetical protein
MKILDEKLLIDNVCGIERGIERRLFTKLLIDRDWVRNLRADRILDEKVLIERD